ncbi:MAG TPA: GH3 auxin-responsive promoter family protein, partial [Bacteroidales bacterium]|nr:GH3 auxin-responsive promoter family protein [Bacteroidales bacterium]
MPILGTLIKSAIELKNIMPVEKRKPSAIAQQKKVLKKLVRKAQLTAFGEHYDFAGMLKESDLLDSFRKSVPIHDYNKMHNDWWYRTLTGEAYVCWPGKVKYFALSSGTSEATSKYIPITPE